MAPSVNLPVLVFDGDCAFCTRSAEVAERWVRSGDGYAVAPWQHLDLAALGLTAAQCDAALTFVDAQGAVTSGPTRSRMPFAVGDDLGDHWGAALGPGDAPGRCGHLPLDRREPALASRGTAACRLDQNQ